jgi:hypothetical protein
MEKGGSMKSDMVNMTEFRSLTLEARGGEHLRQIQKKAEAMIMAAFRAAGV